MPISGGKYVNPGWTNNATPNINATELNAISDTLAQVPVANGGTGATTAAGARASLGVMAKSDLTSKGDNTAPVYFNSNAVATPISVITQNVTDDAYNFTLNKYGKVVTMSGSMLEKSNLWTLTEFLPDGFKPLQQVYGYAFGTNSTSASASPQKAGIVSINTNGSIRIELIGSGEYYCRFTITYIV